MEAASTSKTPVYLHICISARLHGATTHKTAIFNIFPIHIIWKLPST
jgi:hypothetical protein